MVKVESQQTLWCCSHPGGGRRIHLCERETRRWRHLAACQSHTIVQVPGKTVTRICRERLGKIMNLLCHQITKGSLEGLNNKPWPLTKMACGHPNAPTLHHRHFLSTRRAKGLCKNSFRELPCSFGGPLCCSFLAYASNMPVTRASPAAKIPAAFLGINFCTNPKPQSRPIKSHPSMPEEAKILWLG
jgi:hypothetical protein